MRFLLVLFITTTSFGQVINVPGDYQTIQEGINAAANGDTILVANGLYLENINFHGKNVLVTSMFAITGDFSQIDSTIIDGSNPIYADTGSVVLFISGEDSSAVLQGFTITGGTGTDWIDQDDGLTYNEGGGILSEASPTIQYNLIIDNEANRQSSGVTSAGGGGIRAGYGGTRILNNIIASNSGRYGGGIVSFFDNTVIKNNIIVSNSGGTSFGGGGIWAGGSSGSPVLIENNTITDNRSVLAGGGVRKQSAERDMVLRNNIIWGNRATAGSHQISGAISSAFYNLIEDGYTGSTNSALDPIIAWGSQLDYYLGYNSPAVDSGDPASEFNDIDGSRNDIGAYGGPGGRLPNYAPIADNFRISKLYAQPGNDIVNINVVIEDPFGELDSAYAEIESSDETVLDRFRLYDDGLHDDSLSGDDIYGNAWEVPTGERFYIVDVSTIMNDSALVLERENLGYFTTAGPIVFESLEYSSFDTVPNPGDKIFFKITLKNEGLTASLPNITTLVHSNHQCLSETLAKIIGYGTMAAGESIKNSTFLSVDINPDCDTPAGIEFYLSISSSGVQYWEDSLSIPILVGIDRQESPGPSQYTLNQNYPNPFNPMTRISYSLPKREKVSLTIINIRGEEIARIIDELQTAGDYHVIWDASYVASGIYFYKLQAGGFVRTRKMLLLK